MKKWILLPLTLFVFLSCRENDRGRLLIIGGGDKPPAALSEFVRFCHGRPVLVITSASGDYQESGDIMVRQFTDAGCRDVVWRHIDRPEIANSDSIVDRIDRAGGLFFTGGDQDRLMNRVGGTRAEEAIQRLYRRRGGIVGGTSAGAAVMSRVMITGNELINKDSTNIFVAVQAGNVETKRGFGFLDRVVIDQHFAARKRHNRLISVVLEHPDLPGIGIDEDTSILVQPDGRFRVIGDGTVIVYDARRSRDIRRNDAGVLGGRRLTLDVLMHNDESRLEL